MLVITKNQILKEYLGVPRWLCGLSIQLLTSAKVMIPESGD